MKTLEVKDKPYCVKCPYRAYSVREDKLYADNEGQVICTYVACDHYDLCDVLWNHLCNYEEEHSDDDEFEDNEDYSFTSDATYEDRQI